MKTTKLKRGATREDGMVFWGYLKAAKDGEQWMSPDQFLRSKEMARRRSKKAYDTNPSAAKERMRNHYAKNRDKYLERSKLRHRKLANDPQHCAAKSIRHRLWRSLKRQHAGKQVKAHEALGCSWAYLVKHIESNFTEGMSWDNYGEWHIDHIKPLAKFDLTDQVEQARACHYTNLQPLWAKDNIAKGAR
jgi:hypothetical protein